MAAESDRSQTKEHKATADKIQNATPIRTRPLKVFLPAIAIAVVAIIVLLVLFKFR